MVPVLVALPGAWVVRRRRDRARRDRDAGAVRSGVVRLCAALAGESRAGHTPAQALAAAAHAVDGPILAVVGEAIGTARVGGDVPDALDRAAAVPGAAGLRRIAACWRIATGRGAGFAPALQRIAAGLRAEEDAHEEVIAELAGARSTAQVLAGLPVFGLFLGGALGARPVEVLLRTPVGIGCLCAGLTLVVVGLEWTDRLVARAGPVPG
ncbi:type II secretion system F family protein [Embleya sp. NPDC056575]|uniref:type II secretion system F family protein n=1 Tax=Embleya sp. NPDC056575 TaxID=3345869 RepID=UPI003699A927